MTSLDSRSYSLLKLDHPVPNLKRSKMMQRFRVIFPTLLLFIGRLQRGAPNTRPSIYFNWLQIWLFLSVVIGRFVVERSERCWLQEISRSADRNRPKKIALPKQEIFGSIGGSLRSGGQLCYHYYGILECAYMEGAAGLRRIEIRSPERLQVLWPRLSVCGPLNLDKTIVDDPQWWKWVWVRPGDIRHSQSLSRIREPFPSYSKPFSWS